MERVLPPSTNIVELSSRREGTLATTAAKHARVMRTLSSYQALFGNESGNVVIRIVSSEGVSSYMGQVGSFDATGVRIVQASGREVHVGIDELVAARSFTLTTLPR